MQDSNEWINWIEEAISKKLIKYYEFEYFHSIKEIGSGGCGKVYRANWKNSYKSLALKSFSNLNNATAKEIVHEIKLQREVDFHDNIIRFYGITSSNHGSQSDNSRKYLLVLEYADGGTLQNYLKERFESLTWNDKFNLAFQLSCALSCLHGEGIVHRDLHAGNVLVRQGTIKLADFGLSKRIEESSSLQSKLFGIIPYVDPKSFNRQRNNNNQMQVYSLNEKSDVYSIGVLLWEISSGRPPFCNEPYDIGLVMEIIQGLRETPVPNTPKDYVKIYTDCWNSEPENRPNINQVVARLNAIITKGNIVVDIQLSNERNEQQFIPKPVMISENFVNSPLSGNLSRLIRNFSEMNTKEIDSSVSGKQIMRKSILAQNNFNFSIIVNEIVNLYNSKKQNILNYLKNYNVTSQEIYIWLLNNQHDSNAIVVLGNFNYLGIETSVNKQRAFELYQKAASLGNAMGMNNLGYCYRHGIGTSVDKQKALELHQKAANLGNSSGINSLGNCYDDGIGTAVDKQKAFELYQMAANLGNSSAMNSLGYCYDFGIGTRIDKKKAFESYQKAADLGNAFGTNNLGNCYQYGIGTSIDMEKAFKLFQKAADLENPMGINNLGYCYENGIGTAVNNNKAFESYQKAADLGNVMGINNLGYCYQNGIGTIVDKQKAFELYQMVADLGNSAAQYKIAMMYENGEGITRDVDQAIYWYNKSAKQGYQKAQNILESRLRR